MEAQPVFFHWPWYWHLPRLGPWVLLALAVGVPKRNRDRHAVLIFIPLAILSLLWPAVAPRLNLNSNTADQFGLLFESLVTGLALLWLRADTSARLPGLVRVPLGLGLLVLAGLVTVLSAGRTISDPLFTILLIYVVVMGALLLAALALTRRITRRRYVPLRFSLWLALWTVLLTAVSTGLAALAMQLVIRKGTVDPRLLATVTLTGGILGLCLYAVNLPYVLLMFTSPFFHRRFQVWLGVESSGVSPALP